MVAQSEIEEIEHVIRQLVSIVGQRIRRRRGIVADQRIDEEASRHGDSMCNNHFANPSIPLKIIHSQ